MAALLAEPGSAFGLSETELQFPEASVSRVMMRRLVNIFRETDKGTRLDPYAGRRDLGPAWGLDCVCPSLCGAPRRRAGLGGRGQGTGAGGGADLGKAGLGPGLSPKSSRENGIRWKPRGPLRGARCLSDAWRAPSPLVLEAKDSCYKPVTVQGATVKPFKNLMFLYPALPLSLCLHRLTVFPAQLQRCGPFHPF